MQFTRCFVAQLAPLRDAARENLNRHKREKTDSYMGNVRGPSEGINSSNTTALFFIIPAGRAFDIDTFR